MFSGLQLKKKKKNPNGIYCAVLNMAERLNVSMLKMSRI